MSDETNEVERNAYRVLLNTATILKGLARMIEDDAIRQTLINTAVDCETAGEDFMSHLAS